jgi:hypothetical protein
MRMFLEQYGTMIGAFLVGAVALCSVLLARKTNAGVETFSEERHERFTRSSSTANSHE